MRTGCRLGRNVPTKEKGMTKEFKTPGHALGNLETRFGNWLSKLLEVEAKRHLHDSRIVDYAADLAKEGGGAAQIHRRAGEIDVVE
jgi:hypothetical protein